MKKSLFFIIIVLLPVSFISAQDPVTVFNNYRQNLPVEHIYMQLDKQAYVPGETIWYKAYLYTPGITGRLSTNFFAELLNEKGEVIQTKKAGVSEDKAIKGQFEIPVSIPHGVYLIRAWTNYTKNFDQSFVFKKPVSIFASQAIQAAAGSNKTGYIFEWFPESGKTLTTGVENTVAFRCTDMQQQPAIVSGTLLSSKGEDLGSFSSNKYGLGYFNFSPLSGMKYFAELQMPDRSTQKMELPPLSDAGVALSVADNETGKVFSVMTSSSLTDAPKEVLLLGIMDNEVVLSEKLIIKENLAEGTFQTGNLREGVLDFLVFDTKNNLLAQRTTYTKKKSESPFFQLKPVIKNLSPKGRNDWSVVFPAGTTGNFSIAVSDADRELLYTDEGNLTSTVLMQSGAIQPFLLAKNDDDEVRDLILLTSPSNKFSWQALSKKKIQKPEEELHLPFHGKLFEQGNNKLITEGQLDLLIKTKDSAGRQYSVPLLSDGGFKMFDLVFEDTARIYYRWKGNKGQNTIATEIELQKDNSDYISLLKKFPVEQYISRMKSFFEKSAAGTLAAERIKEVQGENIYRNKWLASQKKSETPKQETKEADVNKRYTTGVFRSNANAKLIDLIASPPNNISGNIFNYITGRLSGVAVEKSGSSGYALYTGRSISTNDVLQNANRNSVAGPGGVSRTPQDFNELGRIPAKMYLDEVEVSSDIIARLSVDQIALVKYFPPGSIMLPGIGVAGVLAVYSKKPEDYGKDDSRFLNSIIFPGYSSTTEFYSPDYSVEDKKKPDNRTTLYWNADISLAEGNEIKFSFYNSDKAKRLRIVLEGITSDGKPVSFEKIIE